MSATLDQWIDRQYRHAATQMLTSISPAIVKQRAGFDQWVRPSRGAIVASPVLASYDPDPDYFYHWYRDSALIIDALRLLIETGSVKPDARAYFADFVHFSLSLQRLDGRRLVASPAWRSRVAPDFTRFVRPDAELAAVHGESVASETRVNPDGTLDFSLWGRPQHDGPALRALALLRWAGSTVFDADLSTPLAALLRADLAYTLKFGRQPCIDIWEEENGLHYYTLRVSCAALDLGADWLEHHGDNDQGHACRAEAAVIRAMLDGYWLDTEGYYRSRLLQSGTRSAKQLDIAVILATVHAGGDDRAHSVHDPRMRATLTRLEATFDAAYPINRERAATRAPALGRYPGDSYYSGGAYYFCTLAAAEFYFRAAVRDPDAQALYQRGDAFLETVRVFTPPSGDLSEQFDQRTGVQTSAKHLAWSYAAFVTCIHARRACGQR